MNSPHSSPSPSTLSKVCPPAGFSQRILRAWGRRVLPLLGGVWVLAGGLLGPSFFVGCAGTPSYRGYKHSPYTIRGIRYYPMSPQEAIGFTETGIASHYKGGSFFRHGTTAIGEKLGPNTRAAAHKTLPLPSTIRVTNLRNGRSTVVRVNDRGPFIEGRILDVTRPVAKQLGFYEQGLTPVRIEVLHVGDGKYRIRR